MLRLTVLTVLAFACFGCGPFIVPMVDRLDADQQKQVDQMWHNALTPPDRVSHDTLLGMLTLFQMYQSGVDRVDYHAEKTVDDMRVVMDVHFQREHPADDGFYVTIFGPQGKLLRAERYSREEVEQLEGKLRGKPIHTDELMTPEEKALEEKLQKELLDIQAATQPVGWTPPPEQTPQTQPK